jgi:hypothetical protein
MGWVRLAGEHGESRSRYDEDEPGRGRVGGLEEGGDDVCQEDEQARRSGVPMGIVAGSQGSVFDVSLLQRNRA